MKVTHFTVTVAHDDSIHIQEDELQQFYEHLHRHNETQITWVISGEGTLIIDNLLEPFKPGDIFVIGANQTHVFKSDQHTPSDINQNPVHTLNIFFDTRGVIKSLLQFPEMRSIGKFLELSQHGLKVTEAHKDIICEHMLAVKNNGAGFRLGAFIALLQLMANLKKWKYLSTTILAYDMPDIEGLRMKKIYDYTINNYMEDITLATIAAVIHLTPQSFCRYFKKHSLKTYTSFLNEVRVREACKKLTQKDFDSINAVAYQTGFKNVVSFNRVFKAIMKKSPRAFLKEYETKTYL